MFVIEVIPLSRTAPPAPLSYRSSTKLAIGTIISVPLRRQVLPGLVVDCVPVQEAKYALKSGSYMLRSATQTLSKSTDISKGKLPVVLMRAAEETAQYHATTVGAVLSALLLQVFPDEFPKFSSRKNEAGEKDSDTDERTLGIEAPLISRREAYEKQIAEASGTTLLVVPTQTEADEWGAFLKKHTPLVLSGKITGKRREAALAAAPTHKGVIIATPNFAWVPIAALSGIIIERASAGTYRLPKRPYLDVRYALTALARARNIPVTYGDFPLPMEYRENPGGALRIPTSNTGMVVELFDARPPKKIAGDDTSKKEDREPWQAVPKPILKEIKKTLDLGGRVAVLAVRRGYSPTVVCRDCGTAVTDEHGNTLSLATIGGKRVFRSTDGTLSKDENMFCKVCGGWNLEPLGIGVERVEEELRAAFPEAPIIRIDQDTRSAVSLKKAREELAIPGTIILGTEIMLPLLSPYEPVDLGLIASADSLLALPFWRSRERFVRLGLMLTERAKRTIIVTRRTEDTALATLANPTDDTFWKEEAGLRKILSYPPFGTLIVFSIEGSALRLEEMRASIKAACAPFAPFEPAAKAISETQSKATLVLQLPDGAWPDSVLSARLSALSPAIRIHIDSESLW